ncbi:hypothetical protein B0H16DRAFT_876432 [Mycena metata]|uniref:Uncharacterized protein n=1 Tax=Mycena metata TaxID=1033252 RepID=A0AAD7DKQ9_9AGAR|nr:hypothetical protein B0H16DRAFT_876432 [Mycena metata]
MDAIQKFKAQATAWATDAEFQDTPPSTPSAPPSRLWSAVPGSTSPRRASTSTAPMSPFPVSSSPSDGGNVEMDEPNAIPDTDTDLDMDMDALRRVVSSSSASASTTQQRDRKLGRGRRPRRRSALYSSILESCRCRCVGYPTQRGNGRQRRTKPTDATPGFPQPHLITGATHPYQLEGLQWILGLHEQGLVGFWGDALTICPAFDRRRL